MASSALSETLEMEVPVSVLLDASTVAEQAHALADLDRAGARGADEV
jgi:hypothetical protein